MGDRLDDAALDVLFRDARTHNGWDRRPVDEALLRAVWDVAKWGPTSANGSPLRVVFLVTPEGKERLRPCLIEGNVAKTMAAPATAIFGYDLTFYERLPELYPQTDARAWFAGKDDLIAATAFRNSSLQAAYFMLAARALGLDCGPMSGFDTAAVDAAFFAGTPVRSNFICNIGYGDSAALYPRNKRLSFDEACSIA